MKNTPVRALLFNPDEPGKVVTLDPPSLTVMQKIVNGYIQMIPYLDGRVDLVCNEEGKFDGSTPNRVIFSGSDLVHGPFFFVRHDAQGETASLTDDDIVALLAEFP